MVTATQAQDVVSNHPILNFNPDNLVYDYGSITITNNDNVDYDLKLRQEIVNAPDGANLAICFGILCFPPNGTDQYVYPQGFTLAANGEDTNFKVTYNNNGSDENANWKLVLFDENTNQDIYTFDVFYDGPLGITQIFVEQSNLGLPSPNPVINESVISYELPDGIQSGILSIHNLTGNLVQEIELTQNEGDIRVYSADLEKGVYFYSVTVDGIALHTKRMVIAQ